MTAPEVSRMDRPLFPRLEIEAADDAEASTNSSIPAASLRIVRAAELAKAAHGRRLISDAWAQADQILAQAHEEAAAHLAQTRDDIAAGHAAWYAKQSALFESRTAEAVDLLCRTTGQIAEAVIAALFERMPSLPIQASVDIAVRLLRSEMRSCVLCHALDFDAVGAASASVGSAQTQTDDAVRQGELVFRDVQGEVRVDGTDALIQLLADWKTTLGIALPAPQVSFSPERPTAIDPSTTESEMTP